MATEVGPGAQPQSGLDKGVLQLAASSFLYLIRRAQCRAQSKRTSPGYTRILDGASDAKFADARLQRGAFHAEQIGGPARAGDAPLGLPQSTKNVLALCVLESCDRGRRRGKHGWHGTCSGEQRQPRKGQRQIGIRALRRRGSGGFQLRQRNTQLLAV